jgi:hypothetical protein
VPVLQNSRQHLENQISLKGTRELMAIAEADQYQMEARYNEAVIVIAPQCHDKVVRGF